MSYFSGPTIKIDRARQIFAELDNLINDYIARVPAYVKIREITENYHQHFVLPSDISIRSYKWVREFYLREPVPLIFSAIIGDVIHNCRGALDIMANDLIILNGASNRNAYFPFAKSASELANQIKQKNFNLSSNRDQALLTHYRPYSHDQGGNCWLYKLHRIDIEDKHQLIIPTLGNFGDGLGAVGLPQDASPGKFGMSLHIHDFIDEPLNTELPMRFNLFFSNHGVFGGNQVLPQLTKLINNTEDVIKNFAANHSIVYPVR